MLVTQLRVGEEKKQNQQPVLPHRWCAVTSIGATIHPQRCHTSVLLVSPPSSCRCGCSGYKKTKKRHLCCNGEPLFCGSVRNVSAHAQNGCVGLTLCRDLCFFIFFSKVCHGNAMHGVCVCVCRGGYLHRYFVYSSHRALLQHHRGVAAHAVLPVPARAAPGRRRRLVFCTSEAFFGSYLRISPLSWAWRMRRIEE